MIPMAETGANREYRDRLFKFIFGNPQNKEWTLSLYNAVNGSHYTDASAGGEYIKFIPKLCVRRFYYEK